MQQIWPTLPGWPHYFEPTLLVKLPPACGVPRRV
jgi:hypothetical protein